MHALSVADDVLREYPGRPCPSASENARRSGQGTFEDETSATVSDVEVSLSTEMRLKLWAVASASAARSASRGTSRSVSRNTSIVARFGSIIPAPLAIPTIRPPPTSATRTFG